MLIRVFDLGSNSIKASLFRQTDGQPELVSKDRLEYALGETVFSDGIIPETAIELVSDFMNRQPDRIQGEAVGVQLAVATSAVRSAKNREHVVKEWAGRTGQSIRVLSGREESYLIHHGIVSESGADEDAWIKSIDIGGGSVEISVSQGTKYHFGQSFELGAIRLARQFLDDKPLRPDRVQALRETVQAQFALYPVPQDWPTDLALGSSGNLKAIGKMVAVLAGEPRATRKPQVTLGILEDLMEEAMGKTPPQIQSKFGLTRDRSEIIVPAIIVLQSSLQRFGISRLEVTESGLREGVVQFWSRHGHLQLPF